MKHDLIAVEAGAGSVIGHIVWWRLGGTIQHDTLYEAFMVNDVPIERMPALPSDTTVLRRVLHKIYDAPHVLVRRIGQKAWAIVEETIEYDVEPEYETAFTVRDKDDELEFDGTLSDEDREHILMEYALTANAYSSEEISGFFADEMDRMKATVLRATGGVYYVPASSQSELETLQRVMRCCGKEFHGDISVVPAMRTEDAVTALVSTFTATLADQLKELDEQVESGRLGERALQTRRERLEAAVDKISAYEGSLRVTLDELRGQVEQSNAKLAIAMLKGVA